MSTLNTDLLQKKARNAQAKLKISDEDVKLIQRLAWDLYQYIGYDIPSENKRGTVRRALLIEVVLDAGRLTEELRRYIDTRSVGQQKTLADIFEKADYPTKIALVGPAFPYKEYEAGPMQEF